MPKRNTSEHSTNYAERYADENLSDSKQSGFALDHSPDDRRRAQAAGLATGEAFRAMDFGSNETGPLWIAPRVLTTARKWTFRSCPYRAR